MRFLSAAVLSCVALGAFIACGDDPPAASSTTSSTAAPASTSTTEGQAVEESATVVMASGFLFRPDLLEVSAGTTVTWENTDQILHTATAGTPDAPSGAFDGQLDGAGSSFAHTFEEAGSFAFYCERHPHMRGEVLVR